MELRPSLRNNNEIYLVLNKSYELCKFLMARTGTRHTLLGTRQSWCVWRQLSKLLPIRAAHLLWPSTLTGSLQDWPVLASHVKIFSQLKFYKFVIFCYKKQKVLEFLKIDPVFVSSLQMCLYKT